MIRCPTSALDLAARIKFASVFLRKKALKVRRDGWPTFVEADWVLVSFPSVSDCPESSNLTSFVKSCSEQHRS